MDLREVPEQAGLRHPWEVARARFFRDLLSSRGVLGPTGRVLDVGAGDGYVARTIAQSLAVRGTMVCVDAHYLDSHLRELDGGDARLVFLRQVPPEEFDLLMVLDVIEHVADDRALLMDHLRHVRPGGFVLVSVPAWQTLYGVHDFRLGHFRRYRPGELRALLTELGLFIEASGGLFPSLLLPRGVTALRDRLRGVRPDPSSAGFGGMQEGGGVGGWTGGPFITRAISAGLAADRVLTRVFAAAGVTLPGLSTWALARRR